MIVMFHHKSVSRLISFVMSMFVAVLPHSHTTPLPSQFEIFIFSMNSFPEAGFPGCHRSIYSTPGVVLDCCLAIPPLDIFIRSVARRSALRLKSLRGSLEGKTSWCHCTITQLMEDGVLDTFSDHLKECYFSPSSSGL